MTKTKQHSLKPLILLHSKNCKGFESLRLSALNVIKFHQKPLKCRRTAQRRYFFTIRKAICVHLYSS